MRQTQRQVRTRAVRGLPASESSLASFDRSSLVPTDRLIARIEELIQERKSR